MEKIRIAQIGTSANSHGRLIFPSISKQNDIFEVVGYALPENEREKFPNEVKVFEGYREMSVEEILSDETIDAVAIETEELYLTKYALMAAQAGKHIHMEKPGGIVLADFEELIRIMKETGKVFHTGYMYRYNPAVIELMRKIKAGELGEIISVEAQMNCIHPNEVRQWLGNFPGGMMFFLGCHLVDLVLQIQGYPKAIIPYNKCTQVDGITSEDFGMAIFEYDDGVSFVKTSACEIGGYARRQFVVSGTKGTIELKPFEMTVEDGKLYTEKTEYYVNDWGNMGEKSKTEPYDRYDDMMAAFAAMARGEKENPYTLDYELQLYKTVLKACGSDGK